MDDRWMSYEICQRCFVKRPPESLVVVVLEGGTRVKRCSNELICDRMIAAIARGVIAPDKDKPT